LPIYEIEIGKDYLSPSGIPFRVLDIVSHGQDCSIAMVVYKNLIPTKDYPKNHKWVIEESIFYKTFTEAKIPLDFIELDECADSAKRIKELGERIAQLEQLQPLFINSNPNHWAPDGLNDNIIY
jgi:hypothetical protein